MLTQNVWDSKRFKKLYLDTVINSTSNADIPKTSGFDAKVTFCYFLSLDKKLYFVSNKSFYIYIYIYLRNY